MPPKSKSLFRGPNVKKYEVVYRSHRDPLIHDEEEGGERVLKEVQSYNVIKKVWSMPLWACCSFFC